MNRTEPRDQMSFAASGLVASLRAFLRLAESAALTTPRTFTSILVLVALLSCAVVAPAHAAPPPNFCPAGSGSGQCDAPEAVAVDQSSGDVYVGEHNNGRIDVFGPDEHFLRAFGFGVQSGDNELQTCTTACLQGRESFRPDFIAVDNSGGPSAHDLYAFNTNHVEKYSAEAPKAKLLLSFGSSGTGPGQFSPAAHPLTIDSSGHIWVGDVERLEQFSEAGAFLSEVALPGAGQITSLAVNSAGDFYFTGTNSSGVQKLKPSGELVETLDASGHPNALTLDPASGELFVSDQFNPAEILGTAALLSYAPSGAQTGRFATGQVIGHPEGNALAFGDTAQRLYVASSASAKNSAAQAFALPAPGPLLREGSLVAKPRPTEATLKATLLSEGAATEYRFQYVSQKQFEEEAPGHGFDHATTTPTEELPADFAEHELAAPIAGLTAETPYRFRLLAENANGKGNVTGTEETAFTTLAPVLIDAESVSGVSATAATLEAELNTLGVADEYRFEYLTEAAYQANLEAEADPFTGAAIAPVPDASIGASEEDQAVSQRVQGLSPSTVYRYRVFAHNPGGFKAGPARSFTTQSANSLTELPDNRQWELVSPPDKRGANIDPMAEQGVIQAAAGGDAITYLATAPTEAQPPANSNRVQVLSGRGPGGWASKDIDPPHEAATGVSVGAGEQFRFFSADLSRGVLQPFGAFVPSLSAEATEQTPFLRTNFTAGDPTEFCATSCYTPLVTAANVPEGAEFGEDDICDPAKTFGTDLRLLCGPEFVGATPDLAHVVLGSATPLVEGAPAGKVHDQGSLYEWSAGQLRLISVLPGTGVPASTSSNLTLGGVPSLNGPATDPRHAISADGSRVFWFEEEGKHHLYLSDTARGETLQLDSKQGGSGKGEAKPVFLLASADGSRVFFTDTQQLVAGASEGVSDLYECRVLVGEEGELSCALTDLTPTAPGEEKTGVLGVLGASEDGAWLYYATGPEAAPHVYLRQSGQSTLIAVLDKGDLYNWRENLAGRTARVSPNGRWLAFMSQASPTGYDNRDAVSGKPDQEVYLYHAAKGGEGMLVCASCNPTGARPRGVEVSKLSAENAPIVEQLVFSVAGWLSANVPRGTPYRAFASLYQTRYLSNSGRLFFNSLDSLVPRDSNGAFDVYQYEPPEGGEEEPPSDTCTTESLTYSPTSQGCVSLISSGTSGTESLFLDASESGNDVFFLTGTKLSRRDTDTAADVYDARVGGGEAEPAKPVECSGDACQQPAVPPNHPTPGTALLNGPENEHPAKPRCAKGKVPSRGKCVTKHHKKKKNKARHKPAASHKRRAAR